jgi:hypothetical protein
MNYIKLGQKKNFLKKDEDEYMIVDQIKIKDKMKKPNEEDFNDNWKNLKFSIKESFKSGINFKQLNKENNENMTSIIRTTRMANNIDALEKLLQNSTKYKNARILSLKKDYKDEEFPLGNESLYGFVEGARTKPYENLIWYRPNEFYIIYNENGKQFYRKETTDNYKVYDKIHPEGIIQGRLGDCYFLAACGAIAINPKRLERLFISGKEYNPKGLYAIAICINGIWEEILLDDYFPCNPDSRRPAFSYSKDNTLWMMLLEKAWAKVHLGYLNISCGFTGEALRDLTGAPTESHFFEEQDFRNSATLSEKNQKNWRVMMEGFQKKFIMCASSKNFNNGNDQVDERLGISGNHAYSILGVYDLGQGNVLKKCFLIFRCRSKINQIEKSLGKRRMEGLLVKIRSKMDNRSKEKTKSFKYQKRSLFHSIIINDKVFPLLPDLLFP